jgi:Tfp pilus assembly protein PilP
MKIFIILTLLLLSFSVFAEDEAEGTGPAFNLFKSKTYVKNPLDLRDPFKRRINKKKNGSGRQNHEVGNYTNYGENIESKPVESIRIIGVMIGKDRRAMAKLFTGGKLQNDVYYIKEGMKIGPNGAEVKAILPGGVVLVEKIRNVYDQDEYLETVLPLSND